MYYDNTTSVLPKSVYSYLFLNPFIFNIEQVRKMLNYGVATFFAWAGLFRLENTQKDSADVF
jgi:hypothetical protein